MMTSSAFFNMIGILSELRLLIHSLSIYDNNEDLLQNLIY